MSLSRIDPALVISAPSRHGFRVFADPPFDDGASRKPPVRSVHKFAAPRSTVPMSVQVSWTLTCSPSH